MRGLVVGRFQPLHLGHTELIRQALSACDTLVVGIAVAPGPRNPFTFNERVRMLLAVFPALQPVAIPDLNDPPRWVAHALGITGPVDIVFGNAEDTLGLFEDAGIEVRRPGLVNRARFEGQTIRAWLATGGPWREAVPPEVASYLDSIEAAKRLHASGSMMSAGGEPPRQGDAAGEGGASDRGGAEDRAADRSAPVEGIPDAAPEPPHIADAVLVRMIQTLTLRGLRVAVAESCTGGLLGARLTETPGASHAILGGVVAYNNRLKRQVLNVPDHAFEDGAVSEKMVVAMAKSVRQVCGAELGLAVSGIAGPEGGTEDKPVGTVWIGCDGPGGPQASGFHFHGDRQAIRVAATEAALGILARRVEARTDGGLM